jgi:aspartyl-tRNA(Asn)/glutamyl-tRNA(Gln) amidotransferase subunit A
VNPLDLTLIELRDAIRSREVSAEETAKASLARIDAHDGQLHAFLQTFPERALDAARDTDRRIANGEHVGPLAGVPIALKDNICLSHGRTTCASRFLEHYESPFTCTAAQKLIDAGAVVMGKTNLDEFAMGSSTEHSAFGPSFNPWDTTRVPGGSSGGSASALAARMVSASIGSETGGSVRQPASITNLVGIKPTYGRVSRYGLVAFASSLDQISPFGRTVADAALMLHTIAGHDPLDSTSATAEVPDYLHDLDRPIEGLRLGVPSQARSERNHPAVAACFEEAVETYRARGATIVDIELPHLDYGVAAYYIVNPAEASSNLARFDGIRYGRRATIEKSESLETLYARSRAEGFGAEVQRRIMLGTHALSSGYYDAYYLTALKTRRLIKQDFDNAFDTGAGKPGVHAILMPSTTGPAFKIGEKSNDPLALYLEDIYTVMANLAGLPAMSQPMGFAEKAGTNGEHLPVGLQIYCPALAESRMLRIARMYEDATEWHTHTPAMLHAAR